MAEFENENRPQPRKRRPKKRSVAGSIARGVGTALLVIFLTGCFLACFGAIYIKNVILPQTPMDVADYPMNLTSTIYYTDPATGTDVEYDTLHGDSKRQWVSLDQIPENLKNAAVAVEDKRFYTHSGVDWIGTTRSVLSMFTGGKQQGGSTITQQLIKNLTGYKDVTVKRKVLEIFRALEFDKKYSKDTTLEWYLNYIPLGNNVSGVAAGALEYFGKPVDQLDLAECASLIRITNSPTLYNPKKNPDNNHEGRNFVLDKMYDQEMISAEERDAAKAEVLDFRSADSDDQNGEIHSWYAEQVMTDVINDLMDTYGYSEKLATNLVMSGDLKIYSCVDPGIQSVVDEVYSNVENLPYTSASGQQLQSAIVVVDPNGSVVGLAGKLGEKTVADTRGYNMASMAKRQPGSSIKPLSVYAPALEMGLITPYSVFDDSPVAELSGSAWPSNAYLKYYGRMTVEEAVEQSSNAVAARVLQQVTPDAAYEYMTDKFGFSTDHIVRNVVINGKEYSDTDGLAQLGLGGLTRGVSPLEMAAAYSVFPRDGKYIAPRTYSRVVDTNNKELLNKSAEGTAVLKESTAWYVNQMLKQVVTGPNGTGTQAQLSNMTVAGKTGSTNTNNDRWFVGYTPYYTAAVWTGYSTPERVKASGNPAAAMWKR